MPVYIDVTNVGTADSGAISFEYGPGLTVRSTSQAPLPPRKSTGATLYIAPRDPGLFSSWVSISANPGATPALRVPVIGMVSDEMPFGVLPTSFDLGLLSGGGQSLKIQITASQDLTDLAWTLDVGTVLDATTCTAVLAESTACLLVFDYFPGFGQHRDQVTITGGGTNRTRVTVEISSRAEEGTWP
jgi:hypothetical protein